MKIVASYTANIPVLKLDKWNHIAHGFLGCELDFRFAQNAWSKISEKKLYLLNQIHGADLVDFDQLKDYSTPLAADGWIGSLSNLIQNDIAIGIKTADCTPVLAVGEKNVLALHCGWRSAYAGLLNIGLKALIDRGGGS